MTRTDLPTGTVTFLFTDIEGSTKLLHQLGDRYADVLEEHRRLLRAVWAERGGVEVDTAGDAFFVAFSRATDACEAALAAREALRTTPVTVRIGLHTGTPALVESGYVGLDVHRAARIAAAAHGGQIVISLTTYELLGGDALDLGEHRLKDLAAPERLFQLGDGAFPPLRSLHRTNLPVQPSPLIGRERELASVVEAVREHRIVTLTGPGGSGKTRLAVHAAAELVEDFPDGVFWVALAAVREPAMVLPTVAGQLGATDDLVEHLGRKRVLILLDNLEQIVDAAAEAAALVVSAPGVAVLATSRQPLRVDGEIEFDVPPLAHDAAVSLFLHRARAIDPAFEQTDAVDEICRRLEGLPLALELAAARVRVLSAAEIRDRLDQRLALLTGGRRDLPERQRTLRATIEWTYDLLEDEERDLLARLSVFQGGCTLAAAEEVADASLDVLESLCEKSLLRRRRDRFVMLEVIREFAGELRPASDTTEDRHAHWFRDFVVELEPRLMGAEYAVGVELFRIEIDNVRAALRHARSTDDLILEAEIAASSWYPWLLELLVSEGLAFLAPLGARAAELPRPLRAKVLEAETVMQVYAGDRSHAIEAGMEALQLRRELGEPEGVMRALVNASVALDRSQRRAEADAMLEELAELAREVGNEWYAAIAATNLGSSALVAEDFERAERHLRDATILASRIGDDNVALAAGTNMGHALLGLGRRQEAVGRYRAAAEEWRRVGGTEGLFWCLEGLALAAAATAPEVAARIGGAIDRLSDDLGYEHPPPEERMRYRRLDLLDRALEPAAREALEAEGGSMTLEETVAYALATVD